MAHSFTSTISNVVAARNQRILLQSSSLPAGWYYCDVLNYGKSIKILNEAIGFIHSITPSGYSNYNTQQIGYLTGTETNTTGTYLKINTFSLFVRYNPIGQYVGRIIPISNQPVSVSYGYITL